MEDQPISLGQWIRRQDVTPTELRRMGQALAAIAPTELTDRSADSDRHRHGLSEWTSHGALQVAASLADRIDTVATKEGGPATSRIMFHAQEIAQAFAAAYACDDHAPDVPGELEEFERQLTGAHRAYENDPALAKHHAVGSDTKHMVLAISELLVAAAGFRS